MARSGALAERGSAVVEFALVLPVLLLVTLGLVQVGILVRDQLVLTEAARAGAREAAVTADEGDVRRAVEEASPGLDTGLVTVGVERVGARGEPVTVEVRYAAPIRVPFVGFLFPPEVPMSARATMRQEFE